MSAKVRTAVFPVAGRGTRFLPVTKSVPKEMLPVVDKPLIEYAVEEALAAGVTNLVFITHSAKRAIEDHFDIDWELESALEESGKNEMLEMVRGVVPRDVSCVFIRQGEPLGLGHAVLCARPAVGNEPFYVHLPDDFIVSDTGCLAELGQHFESHGGSLVAVEEVPQERTSSYGIVAVSDNNRVDQIIEKPAPEDAPSNLAVVGRYLLTPEIFDLLENTQRGAGGEIQLTDAIAALMKQDSVFALPFSGKRYDCGSKIGYLQANIDVALSRPDLGDGLRDHLKSV